MKTKTHLPFIVLFMLLVTSAFSLYLPATAGETAGYEVTPCDVGAYVINDDPAGIKVRSGPGEEYSVIATLPYDPEGGIDLIVRGSVGEWMRISDPCCDGSDAGEFERITGWVYGLSLGLRAKAYGSTGAVVPLYEEPNTGSSVLIRLQNDVEAVIIGCRGKWVKVNYRGVEGWLAPGSYCGASGTSCS